MSFVDHDHNDITTTTIQRSNWLGQIPVVVTLASTSLSSPTSPPPIYLMVSRQTYLHIGLQSAVQRLHKFAFVTINYGGSSNNKVISEPVPGGGGGRSSSFDNSSDDDNDNDNDGDGDEAKGKKKNKEDNNNNEKTTTTSSTSTTTTSSSYPVCWFEDEETQMALRWHVFVGVLSDLRRRQRRRNRNRRVAGGNDGQHQHQQSQQLPWKIKLHFTNYPSTQILSLDSSTNTPILNQIQFVYKNSFKQSLCLQYGTNKPALNVTKESHQRLWESIGGISTTTTTSSTGSSGIGGGGNCNIGIASTTTKSANYQLYHQVNDDGGLLLSPSSSQDAANQQQQQQLPSLVPVRVYVNARPPIQKRCCPTISNETNNNNNNHLRLRTLGELLMEWLPGYFHVVKEEDDDDDEEVGSNNNNNNDNIIRPADNVISCRVAGIEPPLQTTLVDLWTNLCHPDHFLYVSIVAN